MFMCRLHNAVINVLALICLNVKAHCSQAEGSMPVATWYEPNTHIVTGVYLDPIPIFTSVWEWISAYSILAAKHWVETAHLYSKVIKEICMQDYNRTTVIPAKYTGSLAAAQKY